MGNMYHPICLDAIRPTPSRHPGCISPVPSYVSQYELDRLLDELVHVALAETVSYATSKYVCSGPGMFELTSSLAHAAAERESSLILTMRSRR